MRKLKISSTNRLSQGEEQVVDFIVDGIAESSNRPMAEYNGYSKELLQVWGEFKSALYSVLSSYVDDKVDGDEELHDEMMDELFSEGEALYLCYMTLAGEGVGIWDGRWDPWFDNAEIKEIQNLLKTKLSSFVDGTGGGKIPDMVLGELPQEKRRTPPTRETFNMGDKVQKFPKRTMKFSEL